MAMKTLIFNGSTRKKGDTQALLDALTAVLVGEVRTLSAFNPISPCMDCRRCWEQPGCAIDDAMQEVYPYLAECDNVVLASPVWFSSLSGPLLNMASRLQTYFCGRFFRGDAGILKPKNGLILLAGAEPGTERKPIETAQTILKHVNARRPVPAICSMRTNQVPAKKDASALASVRKAAEAMNQLSFTA